MTPPDDHRAVDPGDVDELNPDSDEIPTSPVDPARYIPYAGPRRRSPPVPDPGTGPATSFNVDPTHDDNWDDDEWAGSEWDDPNGTPSDGGQVDELAVRRPPPGMTRRDRRDWMVSEAERVAAVADRLRHASPDRLAGGLARPVPRQLPRKARQAWRTADRANRRRWWAMQKDRNLEQRGAGALVLVLIVGAVLVWRVTTTDSASDDASAATSGSASTTASAPGTSPQTSPSRTAPSSSTLTNPSVGSGTSIAPPTASGPRWSAAPSTGVAAVPTVPVTGDDPAAVATTAAPVGTPTAAELLTPQAAVAAWLSRTCPSSWQDPYGSALNDLQSVMTPEAWAQADPALDTSGAQWWAGVVQRQETRVCGPVDAQVSELNPAGDTAVVFSTVQRVVTSDLPGVAATVEDVRDVRSAARQPDGTWLVGPSTWAG